MPSCAAGKCPPPDRAEANQWPEGRKETCTQQHQAPIAQATAPDRRHVPWRTPSERGPGSQIRHLRMFGGTRESLGLVNETPQLRDEHLGEEPGSTFLAVQD